MTTDTTREELVRRLDAARRLYSEAEMIVLLTRRAYDDAVSESAEKSRRVDAARDALQVHDKKRANCRDILAEQDPEK